MPFSQYGNILFLLKLLLILKEYLDEKDKVEHEEFESVDQGAGWSL